MPRYINSPQSVTTNGGIFRRVTSRPWKNPIPIETARAAERVSQIGQSSWVTAQGTPTPTRQTIEPTDRSIPPVMMTKATPIPRIPNNAVRRSRFSWL